MRRLLVTPTALTAMQPAIDATPAARRPAIEVLTAAELTAAGGYQFHQGCLAYADRPAASSWRDLGLGRVVVVLDDVRDPDNVGSVFRSARAFGVGAILLGPGCADPLYRTAIRTSMAATLALPFAEVEPWPAALDELHGRGYLLLATTPSAAATPIADFVRELAPARRIAVLVGSEGSGLSADSMSRSNRQASIPTMGVDSLNVATATAIVLYELTRI